MTTDVDMCTYSDYTDVSYEHFFQRRMNEIQIQKDVTIRPVDKYNHW